jgi:hypothetical protein
MIQFSRSRTVWLALLMSVVMTACIAVSSESNSNAAAPAAGVISTVAQSESTGPALLPPEPPPFHTGEWKTDFSRRTVPWHEIRSGGPPKDGIPSIDQPEFEDVAAARSWLVGRDPVIVFEHNGDARAYPLAILIWHEIVNDVVGEKPVAVTFCPLCNASIVFDRTLEGQVLAFGTTGRLRNSDLVMYDRQTESWWQQFTGEGLVGQYAGARLDFLGAQVISFDDFAAAYSEGKVLKIPDFARSYGSNPYVNYDTGAPFLFDGELDDRLSPTERIIGVEHQGEVKAYPFPMLAAAGAINDEVGGEPLVILYKPGTASALDTAQISSGRDVGSAAAFSRRLGERTLTFQSLPDGAFQDRETGSTWNILGQATAGELAGQQLDRLLAFDHFWFAWSVFYPDTTVYE